MKAAPMVVRVQSSGMCHCVVWHMDTNISEISGATIFYQVPARCWYLAAELHNTIPQKGAASYRTL